MSIPASVMENIKSVSTEINGRTLTLETGRIAGLSMGGRHCPLRRFNGAQHRRW